MNSWRKWHRRIGILVGLQVLLWICGGVVMSAIPIDMVRGQHLVNHIKTNVDKSKAKLFSVDIDINQWQQLSWYQRGEQQLIQAVDFDGAIHYLSPHTQEIVGPLTQNAISELAIKQYTGDAEVLEILLLHELPQEVSHLHAPIYQVNFADVIATRFYIDPQSGQVKSVRSHIWSFYDFFWMLHIMDYDQRKDFNNPLVITASISALMFTFSGFVLLYFSVFKPNSRKLIRKLGAKVDNG